MYYILRRDFCDTVLQSTLTRGWNAGTNESRWEILTLYDKRNANTDAFMRAGDAHPRFAIITQHANGPAVDCRVGTIRQLSGSFIGWIINRFYDKCLIRWYVQRIQRQMRLRSSHGARWSSVIPCECCMVIRAYRKFITTAKAAWSPSIAHGIKAFNGSTLTYSRGTWTRTYPGRYFN